MKKVRLKRLYILYDANLYDILGKQNYRNMKKNQFLPESGGSVEGITKGQKDTFWSERNILYLMGGS